MLIFARSQAIEIMVNDLLKELYLEIKVPNMVCLIIGALTIDKYHLSDVM